jgi:hypothetical protein
MAYCSGLRRMKVGGGRGEGLAIKYAEWFRARVFVCSAFTQVAYVWVFPFRVFSCDYIWISPSRAVAGITLTVHCLGPVERAPTTHRIGALVGHTTTENAKLAASSERRKPVAQTLYPLSCRSFHVAANHTDILLLLTSFWFDLQKTLN